MRTRRMKWAVPATALAVVGAAVALTARGQDPAPPGVRYYQGKVSPAVPGQTAGYSPAPAGAGSRPPLSPSGVMNRTGFDQPPPAYQPPTNRQLPPPQYGTTGNPANRSRFTQPVVAGADGVRQAGATEPAIPAFAPLPGAAPPTLAGSPSGSGVVPAAPTMPNLSPSNFGPDPKLPVPRVLVEEGAAPAPAPKGLPDPKPLSLTGPSVTTGAAPAIKPSGPEAMPLGTPAAPVLLPAASPAPTVDAAPAGTKPTATLSSTPTTVATSAAQQPQAQPPAIRELTGDQASLGPVPARQSPSVTVEVVAPDSVGVGQTLAYELIVRNIGTTAVTNLRVEDEPPAKATFVSSEPAAETGGSRLVWSLGTLDAGGERRIRITVKPGEEGALTSRATVSFAAGVETTVKVTRPRISIAMTGPDVTRVGEKVPFQIKLSNTGSGPAGRISLQAKFSDGLTHPSGQVIEAELANLPAGQTKTLTLEVMAAKSGSQTCSLTAAADGNPAETVKSTVSLVEPMLQVKQTGPAKCLVRGEPVFQVELTNPGTAATEPVQLWASIPAGFDFVQTSDGGTYTEANRSVGWRLAGLPAGGAKTITLKLRATDAADGVVRTVAQAVGSEPVSPAGGVQPVEARSRGLEARAETAIKAEGVPALRFEVVDIEDPIVVGTEAVYEVRVTNQGTGPCTNVQIVADLAEGTTATGATGPTTGRVTGQQITFDSIPEFGVKAEAAYRIKVKGTAPGDHRFRVRLACDQIKTPVVKEENTRFYKE